MLIDEDRVPVGIEQHQTRRPSARLIGFGRERKPLAHQRSLNVAHVFEVGERIIGAIPAGVEGQHVLLKHPLEEADGGGLVLEDQPFLSLVAARHLEPELLVKRAGGSNVLDGQADGKFS